jgi:hypothetical protein
MARAAAPGLLPCGYVDKKIGRRLKIDMKSGQ